MRFPTPDSLTPREIALVEGQLVASKSPIQNFEMLDGFFASLVTGPELVMPRDYLPLLLGDPDDPAVEALPDMQAAQRFLDLVMRHWNGLVTAFMAGDPWVLHLKAPGGQPNGQAWAQGFEIGAQMQGGWDRIMRTHSHDDLLGSVIWLASEDAPDPKRRAQPFSAADREAMLGAISLGLPMLYAATRPGATTPSTRSPRTRATAKPKGKPNPKAKAKTKRSPQPRSKPKRRGG